MSEMFRYGNCLEVFQKKNPFTKCSTDAMITGQAINREHENHAMKCPNYSNGVERIHLKVFVYYVPMVMIHYTTFPLQCFHRLRHKRHIV